MKRICFLLLLAVFGRSAFAADSVLVAKKQLDDLSARIEKLQTLPFERETAALKDGYSSSITSINYFISVGLALITAIGTLLGYIGFKNIAEIKKAHQDELDKLKALKEDLEKNFREFKADLARKQRSFDELTGKLQTGLEKVKDQSQLQETQIEIQQLKFEIQFQSRKEKIDYDTLLELTNKALRLSPNDEYLLTYKALSHGKKGEYNEAITTIKSIPPGAKNYLFLYENLAEIYLFTKKIADCELLFNEYERQFQKHRPTTAAYLRAHFLFLKNDPEELKSFVRDHLDQNDTDAKRDVLTSSQMEDFSTYANSYSHSPAGNLLLAFISYLKGEKSAQDVQQLVLR
jgi:Skp family chaperone for outer membrane proteins